MCVQVINILTAVSKGTTKDSANVPSNELQVNENKEPGAASVVAGVAEVGDKKSHACR